MNTKANKEKQPSAATNMMLEKRRLFEAAEYERRLEQLYEDLNERRIDIEEFENTRSAYVLKIESCRRRAAAMKATLRDN